MGFDLNGNKLEASGGLVLTSSVGNQLMKMGTTGIVQRYSAQPMFRAGGSGTSAQVSLGAATTWNVVIFNATNLNVGSCYSTVNGRFTAPVAGMYMFSAATYCMNAATWYVHAMYWVNAGPNTRRAGGPMHRLYMHGITAGYAHDTESFEIIPLLAGDYVEFRNYPNIASTNHIPQYGHFEGYLLG